MNRSKASSQRLLVAGIGMLLALVWAAWPGATAAATDTKHAKSVLTVTEAQNGTDVDLASGQMLQVKLKSVAGTGYAWTLSGDPAPLKLTKTSTQRSKNTPGASQFSVFQLSANSSGLATVTFVYRRSWEYNVPPVRTFSVRVNVR